MSHATRLLDKPCGYPDIFGGVNLNVEVGDRVMVGKTDAGVPTMVSSEVATVERITQRKRLVLRFDGYERTYTARPETMVHVEEHA